MSSSENTPRESYKSTISPDVESSSQRNLEKPKSDAESESPEGEGDEDEEGGAVSVGGDAVETGDTNYSNEATNNSNGRWTRQEHQRFLEGLQKFGKEWKKVAAYVKSRTVVQTRTHAQKYFQKVTKSQERSRFAMEAHHEMNDDEHLQPQLSSSSISSGGMPVPYPDIRRLPNPMFLDNAGNIVRPGNLGGVKFPSGQGQPHLIPVYMTASDSAYAQASFKMVGESVQRSSSTEEGANLLINSLRTSSASSGDSTTSSSIFAGGKRKHDELQAAQILAAHSAHTASSATGTTTGDSSTTHIEGAEALYLMNKGAVSTRGEREPEVSVRSHKRSHSSSSYDMSSMTDFLGMRPGINPQVQFLSQQILPQPQPMHFYAPSWDSSSRIQAPMAWSLQQSAQNYSSQTYPQQQPHHPLAFLYPSHPPISHFRGSASSVNTTSSSNSQNPIHTTTAPEQLQFLKKVRSCIQLGDAGRLQDILRSSKEAVARFTSADAPVSISASSVSFSQPAARAQSQSASRLAVRKSETLRQKEQFDQPQETASSDSAEVAQSSFVADLMKEQQFLSSSADNNPLNRLDRKEQSIPVLMEAVGLEGSDIDESTVLNMVTLLLAHGADPALTDNDNCSCLHIVAGRGFESVGRLLAAHGCPLDLRTTSNGDTAAHWAARQNQVGFLTLLVEFKADLRIRNSHGESPLDLLGYVTSAGVTTEHPLREIFRRDVLLVEPRLRTMVLFHDDFLTDYCGTGVAWEAADRLVGALRRFRNINEFREYELELSTHFDKAGLETLGRVHSEAFLTFIFKLAKLQRNKPSATPSSPPVTEGSLSVDNIPKSTSAMQLVRRSPDDSGRLIGSANEAVISPDAATTATASSNPAAYGLPSPFPPALLTTARRAAGAVVHAVDRVLDGQSRNAFCLIRPPGHNAGHHGLLDPAGCCGFSIFNNVAVGAIHALKEHSDICQRVAIIDLDMHHGNGTEDILRRYHKPSQLFFFSLHLVDKDPEESFEMFPGSGEGADDDVVNNIVNVPLLPLWRNPLFRLNARGRLLEEELSGMEEETASQIRKLLMLPHQVSNSGRESFRQAITFRLLPALRAFNPDLILLSCGFDGCKDDLGNCRDFGRGVGQVSGMDLDPEDYDWATAEIAKIAELCCDGKIVSVLEGGYGNVDPGKVARSSVLSRPSPQQAFKKESMSSNPIVSSSAVKESSPTNQPEPQATPSTNSSGSRSSVSATPPVSSAAALDQIEASSVMNRDMLAQAIALHVHRLVDPHSKTRYNRMGDFSSSKSRIQGSEKDTSSIFSPKNSLQQQQQPLHNEPTVEAEEEVDAEEDDYDEDDEEGEGTNQG